MDEKIKKPIYKRWWFIVGIVLIIVIGAGGALGGGDDKAPTGGSNNTAEQPADEPAKTPTAVTVDDLITALDENALKAAEKYNGMYVELTGELNTIDASGDYFSLYPSNDDWAFTGVQCDIEDEHLDKVMEFTTGQQVTVIGTITDVGEVLGYWLDVESIK
jgi:hypothetical protein